MECSKQTVGVLESEKAEWAIWAEIAVKMDNDPITHYLINEVDIDDAMLKICVILAQGPRTIFDLDRATKVDMMVMNTAISTLLRTGVIQHDGRHYSLRPSE